jgi:hypothetical protein
MFEDLFIKYCPIFYFHKKEPYMPANFDEILKISGITTPSDVLNANITMITIPKEKRTNVGLGTQILCRTNGIIQVGNIKYIDLIYIVTFTWNGTLEEHAFDKEEVIVRVQIIDGNYKLVRVFGSAHGNGMWFNETDLDFENGRVIMYSANESHAMYNKPRLYKRIFGFGNDKTAKDRRWEPSEFVIIDDTDGDVKIYKPDGIKLDGTYNYFKVSKQIGNNDNNQLWPGGRSLEKDYNTLNLDGFYKFQGGIDNLFTGPGAKVSKTIRIILRVVVILAWVGFLGYIIFRDVLNYKEHYYSKKELILFLILHIFLVLGLFLTGTILGLDIFVLNPINSP